MDYLAGLNPQQKQAVTAGLGAVLVLAGPGSGKTRVLTQRIAYLIGAMGVSPYHILAVTFSIRPAREMENRVVNLLGEQASGLTLGTFHATCARILRREAGLLSFQGNFVIYDADDQVSLVKRAIEDLNLDEKKFRAAGVHASISNRKNELILPENYPIYSYRDEVVKRVYQRYQELLRACNAMDFDDLLLNMVQLLEEHPEVREKYARRFQHVLVDEFQDTNLAQYILLKHLASSHGNLFVVGDADQSIYRWRGADYRNILRFEEDFPRHQVVLLEENYRSTQKILDVAMSVIDEHPKRVKKKLFTSRGSGQKITVYEAFDDREEASFVVDTIASKVARREAIPGDFAVMYRTNAQSRVLEEAFLSGSLPYKLVGAQRFYGRREVKDAIAYLRLAQNPDDEVSLARVINVPLRGIGEKTFSTLRALAQKGGKSTGRLVLGLALDKSASISEAFSGKSLAGLVHFCSLLQKWNEASLDQTALSLLDLILNDVDYRSYIDDGTEEGVGRWENVMELRRIAAEYRDPGLDEFLERVALVSDQDTVDASASVPTLLTLHAAKGLEFPVVFIVGLDEGTLPHARSFDDPEGMLEERRLLYVGITRAKDRLYLSFPLHRSSRGFSEPVEPSRYLSDLPPALLEEKALRRGVRSRGAVSPAYARIERWEKASAAPKEGAPLLPRFSPGARVVHPVWGEGMVLNSKIQDGDETVDVFFENLGGMKRVIASLAKLEIKP